MKVGFLVFYMLQSNVLVHDQVTGKIYKLEEGDRACIWESPETHSRYVTWEYYGNPCEKHYMDGYSLETTISGFQKK